MSIETKVGTVKAKEGTLIGEGASTLVDCTDKDIRITALHEKPYISLHIDEDVGNDPDNLKEGMVNVLEFHKRPVVIKFDESNKIDCFTSLLNKVRTQFTNKLDKFEVFTDHKKVVKVTLENGKQGKAKCNNKDTFNLMKGIEIAYNRANGIEPIQKEVKPMVNHAEIGDIIVLSNGLHLKICKPELCGHDCTSKNLETNKVATHHHNIEDLKVGRVTFGMGLDEHEIVCIIKPNRNTSTTKPLSNCTNEELMNELQRRLNK